MSITKKRKRLPIALQIFFSLLALSGILIAFIWGFQMLFLRVTFRLVVNSSTERISNQISEHIDDPEFENYLYSISGEYRDVSIAVFKVEDEHLSEIFSDDLAFEDRSENQQLLSSWLAKANESDEKLYKHVSNGELLHVKLAGRDHMGAHNHMIALKTSVEPPALTKFAFSLLILLISVVALIISIVLSWIISRRISAPISRMSNKAKNLSLYDYDVKFDEKGAKEIEELAEALNSSTAELKKLSTTQKELIANISHDLRTPLTMISGYSEVMRDFPDENTPENMQVIIDETARLNSLVNDLLTVSKLQSGTQTMNPKEISLTKSILDTVKRYEKLLEHKEYKILFEYDCEVFVIADETRLLQVVYNLINNAINYTGEDKTVTVKQEVKGNVVRISVIDTGEGISEENLPLIWDRYYKVDKIHKRAILGTGLGLSIVKNILLLHDSRFGVSSEVGKGSIFWFEFKIEKKQDNE